MGLGLFPWGGRAVAGANPLPRKGLGDWRPDGWNGRLGWRRALRVEGVEDLQLDANALLIDTLLATLHDQIMYVRVEEEDNWEEEENREEEEHWEEEEGAK